MIRAIVTDIEGTTSDIRFVHQVLFPYARERLADFVRRHAAESEVAAPLAALRAEIDQPQADLDALIAALYRFMDEDRKSTALKALQGIIWRSGYREGDFRGHLYPEVVAVGRPAAAGVKLYVYSSGSVEAQKLLFGHSDAAICSRCSAAISIRTSAPSVKPRRTATSRRLSASRPTSCCFCPTSAGAGCGAGRRLAYLPADPR